MASNKLIQSVIDGVVLSTDILSTGVGRYQVETILSISWGGRNRTEGYFIHVYEQGGCYSNDSFYGDYATAEEAAEAAIESRRILAVDTQGNVVRVPRWQ